MKTGLAIGLSLIVFSTSCATVREVKSRPGKGGELALKQGLFGEPADVKAERIMKGNCRRGYKVVEKGEEVIGSTTTHSSSTKSKNKTKDGASFTSASATEGEADTTATTDTVNKTEFRMKYVCRKKGEPVDDDE